MGPIRLPDYRLILIVLFIVFGFAGWLLIELLIWLFSFVDISIVKGGAE